MDLGDLDIFYGELTVNRAFVYARLPRPADDDGLSLVGQVRGPRCLHAQTLPLTSPLVDLGPGPTLLARALIPDPCFWSPDLPAIYDVTVNLLRGTEIIASARHELGFRSLGVRGRNLALEGKRWVLRGVTTTSTTAPLPRAWHEASAALCIQSGPTLRVGQAAGQSPLSDVAPTECGPFEDRLSEASQFGALALIDISQAGAAAVAALRKLAQFPAVAIASLRGDLPAEFKASAVGPNILLAQDVQDPSCFRLQPWAQLLVVAAEDPQQLAQLAATAASPVIARRRLTSPLPIDQARAACDALQRDLAPLGQFAGYVV